MLMREIGPRCTHQQRNPARLFLAEPLVEPGPGQDPEAVASVGCPYGGGGETRPCGVVPRPIQLCVVQASAPPTGDNPNDLPMMIAKYGSEDEALRRIRKITRK